MVVQDKGTSKGIAATLLALALLAERAAGRAPALPAARHVVNPPPHVPTEKNLRSPARPCTGPKPPRRRTSRSPRP